jgi:DNA mismatch repair protein MutL
MKSYIHIAKSMAKSMAIARDQKLQPEEINGLVEQLFSCKAPEVTPDGKPVMMVIGFDELNRKFK